MSVTPTAIAQRIQVQSTPTFRTIDPRTIDQSKVENLKIGENKRTLHTHHTLNYSNPQNKEMYASTKFTTSNWKSDQLIKIAKDNIGALNAASQMTQNGLQQIQDRAKQNGNANIATTAAQDLATLRSKQAAVDAIPQEGEAKSLARYALAETVQDITHRDTYQKGEFKMNFKFGNPVLGHQPPAFWESTP